MKKDREFIKRIKMQQTTRIHFPFECFN